jgi:chromosome segregation ATPase
MEHLSEINDNLQQLRDTNKLLKRKVIENEKELQKLTKINSEQELRINELESLINKNLYRIVSHYIFLYFLSIFNQK